MKHWLLALYFFLILAGRHEAHAQFSIEGPEMICAGTSTTLTAVGCAGSVQWSTGALTDSITFTSLIPALLTATCNESGTSPKKANHSIGIFPKPPLTASSANLCANENVTLTTNSIALTHDNIIWKRDGQPIVSGSGAFVANQTGTYTVEDGVTPGLWVPYPSAPAGKAYRTLFFVDDNNGWAILGRQDLVKTGDGGKTWVKPDYMLNLSPDDSLVDMAFADATTGWACAGGKIFKTSDGGMNWVSQYANDSMVINDLFFLDNQRGWVSGKFSADGNGFRYESAVLRTTDGGATWQRANPSPGSAYFTGMQFISPTVGWGISNAFDPNNGFLYDGTLMKSTDGGVTWSPQVKNYLSGPLSCVYFQDDVKGWLTGSSFFARTNDGGNTWSYSIQISVPFFEHVVFPHAINFVGETGWVLDQNHNFFTNDGGESWVNIPYSYGILYPSTAAFLPSGKVLAAGRNGGVMKFLPKTQSCLSSLTILPAPPAPKVVPSTTAALCQGESITLTASGCVGALSWSTGSTAAAITVTPLATTSYTSFCAGASGCSSTTYAGVAVLPKARLDTASAAPCFRPLLSVSNVESGMGIRWTKDGQPVAYQGTKPYLAQRAGTYAAAVDAAAAWRPQTATRSDTYEELGYLPYDLSDVQFVNDSTGFIVGRGGQFLRTSDGGRNWIASKLPVRGIYDEYNLHFTDAMHGWIAGSFDMIEFIDDMLITSDGGLTWTRVPVLEQGSFTFLRDICFVNPNVGWATGYTGKIIKSTDGGLSWQIQLEDFSQHFTSIFFLNNQTGWAGAGNGTIFTTVDGGANWLPHTIANVRNFQSIQFLDASKGWAIAAHTDNGLYHTTDGGLSWIRITVDVTHKIYLNKVQFLNDSIGFVQSEKFIHATTDGGVTWKKSYHHLNAAGMSFTDATHGWVVGGEIMTYAPAPPACTSDPVTVLPFAEVPLSTLASGNWNAPNVWSCGTIPTALDAVIIDAAHTITLPYGYTAETKSVDLRGQIQYNTNASLQMGRE